MLRPTGRQPLDDILALLDSHIDYYNLHLIQTLRSRALGGLDEAWMALVGGRSINGYSMGVAHDLGPVPGSLEGECFGSCYLLCYCRMM